MYYLISVFFLKKFIPNFQDLEFKVIKQLIEGAEGSGYHRPLYEIGCHEAETEGQIWFDGHSKG